ncbi:3-hydroxyacyl-CoA dehydrogenase, NAD binding domain protein [Bacteriovorax sp. DB6_IX]|nr:3-hydroxyacyl-CoA dehydrogenase, NAD binding domain protein [Bacteriovorax sp. DB6_IX]
MSSTEVKLIGVVGAGQMGRGIAQVAAMSDYQVVLFDINQEGLDFGHGFIKKQLDRGVEKGKWDSSFVEKALGNLKPTTNMNDLKDCDLVIEAATENKKIKFEIFKSLDEIVKDDAILASNTSSISITEIAAATKRAEKLLECTL